jgi:hypothetical protein
VNVLSGEFGGTDSDIDGDALTVLRMINGPSNGSATLNSGKHGSGTAHFFSLLCC